MRKNFGAKTWAYPMPVFIVAAFDKEGRACCMNAAWGGIYDTNQVMVCLADDHKTTKNILESAAFSVSIADAKHVKEADFVGIVSGNQVPDKMERAGFGAIRSEFVNAPVIPELPMTLECSLIKFNEDGICIGEIRNVSADESVLGKDGLIDPEKLEAITYDPVHHGYYTLGKRVGTAFSDGKSLVR
ncbi:MAG: flavin reductase family protein [Clostridia bacterium]|nr:flavin reductase family protein [Clostridia bacterium]